MNAHKRLPAIRLSDLTQAQRVIAADLCRGYTLEEIVKRTGRSRYTIKNHLRVIFNRYGIARQHQLVAALFLTWTNPIFGDGSDFGAALGRDDVAMDCAAKQAP